MINFIRYRYLFLGISAFFVVCSLILITTRGFRYSVEFVGGGSALYSTKTASAAAALSNEAIRAIEGVALVKGKDTLTVTAPSLTKLQADALLAKTKKTGTQLLGFDKVSASISKDNVRATGIALLIAVIIMLVYIGWVFKGWRFGVAAIVALLHDTFLLLGAWALLGVLFQVPFDVLFVTAVLTVMSFSVHDTIVIFDKIKDEQKTGRFGSLGDVINGALTLTMARSVNNSLTIILMLTSLFILGGGAIRWFAFALLLGTFFGAYSSPFIATPVYYLLVQWSEKKR